VKVRARSDSTPARSATRLALMSLLLAASLNAQHCAWWCLPVLAIACAWHLVTNRAPSPANPVRVARAPRAPSTRARAGLAMLLTLAVLVSFRTLNGLDAGATLLTAMIAAKLFEARSARDWYVVIGAALFLLLAACLDRQQLWRLPLYALTLWLSGAALRGLAGGTSPSPSQLLRGAAGQLWRAAPLALLLFVFFPRLPGAFWALPATDEAITGLGDEMSPGDLSRLVESDATALRARFDGPPPPVEQRYWRGPVLHDFDGRTWRRRPLENAPFAAPQYAGPAYHYSVTVEPNRHGTVLALEMAQPPDLPMVRLTPDYQLLAARRPQQAQGYSLTSFPQANRDAPLSATLRRIDLALPSHRNPRTVALAQQLRAEAPEDAALVTRAMQYLHDGGYRYTLTPQRLGRDGIDELLFDTHEGFCAHYASAFAVLMRAAGVPARVVTGYLGGEWNRIGGYLLVRQSEAHAWTEVWLSGHGWVRADPTAMVAPERLTRGVEQLAPGRVSSSGRLLQFPWLANTLQAWDALNAWWQDDVVGFNFSRQLDLAHWLGFADNEWQRLAAALGVSLIAWMLWMAWSLRTTHRPARVDALARAWGRIDTRLRRAGLPRAAHEGVLAYTQRLAPLHPALAAALAPLARRYARLRYGPPPTARRVRAFARRARAFRIQRA